ncbi:MAG: BTAD domain-containing putative transcriptional regulator [Actinocatenispora sp.]
MEFRVLGPVAARDGEREFPVGSARERTVLANLLLHHDRLVPIDRLIDALWSTPPPTAKAQIHNLVSSLRRRYRGHGDVLIVTRPGGYQLRLGQHTLDLVEFRDLVGRGTRAANAGEHGAALDALSDALARWRGVALADVAEQFAADARPTLEEEWLAATETRIDVQLALRRHDDVLRQLGDLLADHPYREHLYRRQMLALVGAGRSAEALDVYRTAYRRLSDDLGISPGPELRDLEQRILRGERVAQSTEWRTLPRELPTAPGQLVGREALLGRIRGELRTPAQAAQPVVLVGPGGVGKSALALTVGHDVSDQFPDGQLYADLRGVQENPADPHAVLGRFLRALGVAGSQLPDDLEERVSMYRSLVAGRRILTVLDDAGSDSQVRPLLPSGTRCATLITSRRRLPGLISAFRHSVPVLTKADAVQLLTRSAGKKPLGTGPDPAMSIVDMCGQLPLAVCIASARLAVRPDWTMEEFRQRLEAERGRLDELTAGDLDVRANIALSYRTLKPVAQRLFRLLALAPTAQWPGWVPGALLGDDALAPRVIDDLVEVHLVEPLGRDAVGQARFQMHALVRAFAAEAAAAHPDRAGQEAARGRLLAGWFGAATIANQGVAHGITSAVGLSAPAAPDDAARAARQEPGAWFEVEQSSLADAVRLAVELDLPDVAGGIALCWSGFLLLRGFRTELDQALTAAIGVARASGPDDLLIRLLSSQYVLLSEQGRYTELAGNAAEKVAIADRIGDLTWRVMALVQAGRAARTLGDLAEAERMLTRAVSIYRVPDASPVMLAGVLTALAVVHVEAGEPERALPLLAEALPLQRSVAVSRQTALQLDRYAAALRNLGRLDEAEVFLHEALEISRQLGDQLGIAFLERNLAEIDIRRGDWARAAERLARARQTFDTNEHLTDLAETLSTMSDLAGAQDRWHDAVELARGAVDNARGRSGPLELARFLVRLDHALAEAGDEEAARACRREWQDILRTLRLGTRVLGPLLFEPAPLDAAPLDATPTDVAPPNGAPIESAPPAPAPPDAAPPDSAPPESTPSGGRGSGVSAGPTDADGG